MSHSKLWHASYWRSPMEIIASREKFITRPETKARECENELDDLIVAIQEDYRKLIDLMLKENLSAKEAVRRWL